MLPQPQALPQVENKTWLTVVLSPCEE
jgi:hypothetical protein